MSKQVEQTAETKTWTRIFCQKFPGKRKEGLESIRKIRRTATNHKGCTRKITGISSCDLVSKVGDNLAE